MHCGVLCLVPGHAVLLKLYLSDNQRMSTSERLPAEPRACGACRLPPSHPRAWLRSDLLPSRHALNSVRVGGYRHLSA